MKVSGTSSARMLVCALALVVINLPMGGTAGASHADRTLDLTPESHNNPVNDRHNVIATLSVAPDTASGPITIHFEITGDGDPGPSGQGSGIQGSVNTPDGNTPETPDRTCAIEVGATECRIYYRSPVLGFDQIRGWIDHDETLEADMSEGLDERVEPGSLPETDGTDMVKTKWYDDVSLDTGLSCIRDHEKQPRDQVNTVTCSLHNSTGSELEGWEIDAENLAGANDPDDSDAFDGMVDYDGICTTGANGKCSADIPTELEIGTATVCFWVDEDRDPSFHAGPKRDGSQCDDPEPAPGEDQGSHHSTTFQKVTWFADRTATLTASKATTTAGRPLTLSGSATSDVSDCMDEVQVNLQRAVGDTGVFKTVDTAFTDEGGTFIRELSPNVSGSYRAVLRGEAGCADVTTNIATVDVRKSLTLNSSRRVVRRGRVVRLRAEVLSCTEGVSDKVVLFKRIDGVFEKREVTRTNADCVANFTRRIKKRSIFKAQSPEDADQLAGYSSRVLVRIR